MSEEHSKQKKSELYSALVWILGGLSLVAYCIIGLLNASIPGVEDLVTFLSTVEGKHIYVAAFISIFVEGLYFIGSFFPGSTLVVILVVLSQLGGIPVFIGTILAVFTGWCVAGIVNIWLAKTYRLKIARLQENDTYKIKDNLPTTWFPAFRANYEVAQITYGGNPFKVFLSSVRVKLWSTLVATLCILSISLFISIEDISNEEGFATVILVAIINFIVGGVKLKNYFRDTNT
ncbi:MAG: hypothetical protein WDZ88_03865 [Candidatus Paceibacterota bacterium]